MCIRDSHEPVNFRITDEDLGAGGLKAKFRANVEAIQLLHELESDERMATPEEQEILSRYVGWGGLPYAFDEKNKEWEKEFTELYETLSPEEYEAARESTLNAFYTCLLYTSGAVWIYLSVGSGCKTCDG